MKKLFIVIFGVLLFTAAGCNPKNVQKAKEALKENEGAQDVQLAILFDNSVSYKQYVENTLEQVKGVFQQMASRYPESEVSLIMLNTESTIMYSGLAKNLQVPYDELKQTLRHGRSNFTDLSGGVERALYFLNKAEAKRKVMLIFSDMKASTPTFHPGNEDVVPTPPDFPWQDIKQSRVETYALYVPYKEWKVWDKAIKAKGVGVIAKLPEELKVLKVSQMIFSDEE